jgi:ATP-dependent Lon protease
VAEISTEIKSGMEIIYVESMDEVVNYAFAQPIKPLKAKTTKRKPKITTEED